MDVTEWQCKLSRDMARHFALGLSTESSQAALGAN